MIQQPGILYTKRAIKNLFVPYEYPEKIFEGALHPNNPFIKIYLPEKVENKKRLKHIFGSLGRRKMILAINQLISNI